MYDNHMREIVCLAAMRMFDTKHYMPFIIIVRSKINVEVQVYAGIIGGSAPCVHLPYKVACVGLRFGFPRGGAQQHTRHCDAASSSASCGGDSTVTHISRRHEQLR